MRKVDPASAEGKIVVVDLAHRGTLLAQGVLHGGGKQGRTILVAFAAAHEGLAALKVDVLDA